MRIYWMWLIWSIGGVLDLTLVTWNLPVRRGRKFLEVFYGIMIPFLSIRKLHRVFQGKGSDIIVLLMLAVLILGTWWITETKLGGVLTAFALLYVSGLGSELLSLGIVQSILGLPVLPLAKAQGAMLCVMMTNGFLLFYLMVGNWLWKRYGQEKRLNRDFLLFFLVLVQTIFLFWIVYAGYQGNIRITPVLLVATGIVVFGTMSFSFIQIHDEETREEEKKLKKIELQSQKEYERYRKLEEMERMLHQIRHDFNNQLSMVYYFSKEGKTEQAKELLDEMKEILEEKEDESTQADGGIIEDESAGLYLEDNENKIQGLNYWEGQVKRILRLPTRQILLLPVGQFLLLPAIWQILEIHWGGGIFAVDMGILFLTLGTDGIWLFLLFNQWSREKRNEQILAQICRQQTEQNREEVLREGLQERNALRKELLSCLKDARAMVEVSRELSVFQGFMAKVQKKEQSKLCDNELVNTVLEEKQKDCRNFHIPFAAEMDVPEILEVKSSHLCSIFANLLDNGIHACQSLPENKRWIFIQSKRQGDYLYLRVSNATSEEYMKRPSAPGHGLGRQIVARLAAEYQGEFWTKASKETYVAAVVLQIYGKSKITSDGQG